MDALMAALERNSLDLSAALIRIARLELALPDPAQLESAAEACGKQDPALADMLSGYAQRIRALGGE